VGRVPALVLAACLALLVGLGMLPALRAYRAAKAEHVLMLDRYRLAARSRRWMQRHPEKRTAQDLREETALIAFLQEAARCAAADLESVRPVFPSQNSAAKMRARRLLVFLRCREQGMRAFLGSLEEASMPWRIESLEVTGDRRREAEVAVHLALERMGEEGASPGDMERYFAQEGRVMKTSRSALDLDRAFFRPPAPNPKAAPHEDSGLVGLSEGWELVGILLGADPRAVIEDKKNRRVFTVRVGDAVAGATVGPIDADSVVFTMGAEALRLTFE